MIENKLCPFCGKSQAEAPEDCVCQSYTMMQMSRAKWNTRPIEDALTTERDSEQRWANHYHQQADALRAEVERLREAQRWIPVEECLPSETGKYLWLDCNNIVNTDFWDTTWNHIYPGYTHWMPLPEPPAKEVKS